MKKKKQIQIIGLKSIEVLIPECLDSDTQNYIERLVDKIEQKIAKAIGETIAEKGRYLIEPFPEEPLFCPNGCGGRGFRNTLEAEEHAKVCPNVEVHAREQAAKNKRLMKLTNVVWGTVLKHVEPGRCKVNPTFWHELYKEMPGDKWDKSEVVLRFGEEGKLDIFEEAEGSLTMYVRPQTYSCNDCGVLVDSNADPEEHLETCADRQHWIELMIETNGPQFYEWLPSTFTFFVKTRQL